MVLLCEGLYSIIKWVYPFGLSCCGLTWKWVASSPAIIASSSSPAFSPTRSWSFSRRDRTSSFTATRITSWPWTNGIPSMNYDIQASFPVRIDQRVYSEHGDHRAGRRHCAELPAGKRNPEGRIDDCRQFSTYGQTIPLSSDAQTRRVFTLPHLGCHQRQNSRQRQESLPLFHEEEYP